MGFKNASILCLALGLSAGSFGDWNKLESSEFKVRKPPAVGSAAHEEDFKKLHDAEATRTKDQCDLAAVQVFPTFDAFFGPDQGFLTQEEADVLKPFISKVMRVTEHITADFKNKYMRERPYDADTSLTPCAKKPGGHKAYPSSHASMATAGACVLSELFPSEKSAFKSYAKRTGDLRWIVGVHHPSDVKAGQTLGQQICDRLLEESDFVAELDALRSEL